MISFIIPAYNEEQLLGRTLTALTAAARALAEPFEIIVVDDASTDRTAAIAREHGARVVSVAHRQISATRNAGARAATGEMFLFIDADTVVNERAVAAAVAAMRAGAVGGFDERLFGAEEAAMSRALHRQGRFVILRESVTTSGRKLRAYSAREVLGLLARLAVSGRKAVRKREGMEIWYGERRPDPEPAAEVLDRPL